MPVFHSFSAYLLSNIIPFSELHCQRSYMTDRDIISWKQQAMAIVISAAFNKVLFKYVKF